MSDPQIEIEEGRAETDLEQDEGNKVEGIVKELGELVPGAIITEVGLAKMFERHKSSVKRAVKRGELPPPTKLFGGPVWTAGVLVHHFEKRLNQAAKEAEKLARKKQQLQP